LALTHAHIDCKSLAPTWETLADDFANEPNVLIAKVDAEADNAKNTAKSQGVTSYPTIKFFPAGSKTPENYNGGRDEASLVKFVNGKAGTHRSVGGILDDIAGTIPSFDSIVSKFTGAGATLAEAAAEAKKEAEALKEQASYKYAEYYIRVFDKLNKSEGFAAKELARLEGILKKGGLAPAKVDELTSKTNILRRFVNKVTGQDSKDEL
jgi:protein disulfide-isomerase A6